MIEINSNCGILTPQTFDIIQFQEMPSVQHSHIPYFHSQLCSWANNIALPFLWVVVIHAHSKQFLFNKIKSTLPNYEPVGWNTSSAVDATWTDANQEVIGCIFCQAVRIPGETVNFERVGITEGSKRGFINGPIANGRSDFEPLELTFLETNQSFTDGVLRPWNIIVGHEGLLAMPKNSSIKSDIYVFQLAKAGNETPNIIRKSWKFTDCVPAMVPTEDLTYSGGDYGKRICSFVYNSYSLETPIFNQLAPSTATIIKRALPA